MLRNRDLAKTLWKPALFSFLTTACISSRLCRRSDPSEFDFESLVFPEPDFNFLQSREFFLSENSECVQPLGGLTVEPIPIDAAAKQALAEQRYIVKGARDMVKSMARQDDAYIKQQMKMQKAMQNVQYAPAVELHMFPASLENSTFQLPSSKFWF